MGRDILAAGLLGAAMVILITILFPRLERVLTWPRHYARARGYEFEFARHTAAALRAELDALEPGAIIPRADVAGEPPWKPAEPVDFDPGRYGLPVPEWADPYADRYTGYGGNSGSNGSDYGRGAEPGVWPTPAGNGTGDGGRTSAITGDDLGPLADTWARLEQAWADGTAAPSVILEGTAAASSPESGRQGPAALLSGLVASDDQPPAPGSDPNPGPGGDAGMVPSGAAPSGPAWAPTRLGTLFDAVLAAEASAYIQDQNRDVTEYLERLLGVTW